MRMKIHNGTVANGECSLCTSCRHSTIIRGRTLEEEIVHCHGLGMRGARVTFKVTSCSSYSDQRLPTYMDMLDEAWILQPGSKRRPAGFMRGRDLREDELTGIMTDLRSRWNE